MKTKTLDTLIWVLIYGGLLTVGLGLSVRRTDQQTDGVLGTVVLVAGGVVALIGFALIYVRSRMKSAPPQVPRKD